MEGSMRRGHCISAGERMVANKYVALEGKILGVPTNIIPSKEYEDCVNANGNEVVPTVNRHDITHFPVLSCMVSQAICGLL